MKAKFKLKDRVIIDKNAYPTLHQGKWIITNVQNVLNQYRYTVTDGLFQVIVLENEIKLYDNKKKSDLLLNKFGDSVGAYSLRYLNNYYRDNKKSLILVRRSSDNLLGEFNYEEIINGKLESWVGTGNDGFVHTWYDQSGKGNNLVQNLNPNQPKIIANGSLVLENNKPALEFNGVSNYFSRSLNVNNLSSFIVARIVNELDYNFIFDTNLITDNARIRLGLWVTDQYFAGTASSDMNNADEAYSTIVSNNKQHKFYAYHNSVKIDFSVDGESIVSTPSTYFTGNTTNIYIGARNDGVEHFLEGTLQELTFYNNDKINYKLSIEQDINDYYSVY